jgi:hypothetical protein
MKSHPLLAKYPEADMGAHVQLHKLIVPMAIIVNTNQQIASVSDPFMREHTIKKAKV